MCFDRNIRFTRLGSSVSLKVITADEAHPTSSGSEDVHAKLLHAIDHSSHLLPAQGPITVFIHHNTLHAFEDLSFDEAVQRGAEVFGCHPYLTETRYRNELTKGRIAFDDLRADLHKDLRNTANDTVTNSTSRLDLRLAMLQYPFWTGTAAELEYVLAESDALKRVRSDVSSATRARMIAETRRWVIRELRGTGDTVAPGWVGELFHRFGIDCVETWEDAKWEAFSLESLWQVCCAGVQSIPIEMQPAPTPIRHRDWLVAAGTDDPDLLVNEFLVRFCAAFLDQGISLWPLPDQNLGFYLSFLRLHAASWNPPELWLKDLRGESQRLLNGNVTAIESIRESLEILGVMPSEWDKYLDATLLALRGWGGMIRQVEVRGDSVAHPIPGGTLVEFVAVRLLLDRFAVASVANEVPLAELRETLRKRGPKAEAVPLPLRVFPIFQLSQLLGWSASELHDLSPADWKHLSDEIAQFGPIERRRVFHQAYERRFRNRTLDAVSLHYSKATHVPARPRFQVITCLDEREESFRRHLEEVAPDCETFGAAGFFGVAMYFRSAAGAHFTPLCPIIIRPGHWVSEMVCEEQEQTHRWRAKVRKVLGGASHRFHIGSRSFATGAVLTAGVGVLASVPLVASVLFPRLAAMARGYFGRFVQTPLATRLKLERGSTTPGPEITHHGYTLDEMATLAERLLRDIGMTVDFAPLVFILGHGSHSMNNPHESAHDCGACGGGVGGPNGRAIAQMLNDPRVREAMARRGVVVPNDTAFVGGLHNTCNEYVEFPDADLVPESHRDRFAAAEADIERALDRNSHERARRFESAPLAITPAAARRHMAARAEDLAQVRPEWGHATNAICIVGRRERTRGLFLDRRAFLTSYNPAQDDENGSTLGRLLGAAVPVCAGINLEYYFCHVDSQGYGCGTKLPHNITGLLGVMDGAASDLRTGLPWQMVEIHEPVRLLFIVETTPEILLKVMSRSAVVDMTIRRGWVQMCTMDPDTGKLLVFQDGEFLPHTLTTSQLPTARSSADWYRGWREFLDFAAIRTGATS